MRCKILVCAALLSIVLAAPAAGKIVEYSDDYVSFSYDDEMIGQIRRHMDVPSNSFYYFLDSGLKMSEGIASCTIGVKPADSMFGADYYRDSSDPNSPQRVIEESSTQFSYISLVDLSDSPDSSSPGRIFYDSAAFKVSLEDVQIDANEDELIFSNVILSDQGYTYAEKALDILRSYMDFTTPAQDAADQMTELYDQLDSYVDTSDYYFDGRLRDALLLVDTIIAAKDDGKIQVTIEELESFLQNKEDTDVG